uniref:Protein kinase domain-containing protein n=1 Tax=Oryzias latipes TaxID=8090 RepID=A0A3B3HJA3_ORYLA
PGPRCQVGKFLGRGSYGRVAECTKMGSNETFAIKIVDDLRAGSEEMEAMKIIRSLNPDQNNLIKIHECFQYKDYMCLVYEMLDESLEDFIGKRSFHPAHLCQIRAIAQQMLVALSGLESINVLHGDIKPDNIMFVDQITNPLKLKLIDFGLAVNPQELNVGTQMQINPFRAPEVILGLPLDVSVDMWSLAVVLATLYIGDVPFSYNSDYETIRGLVQLLGLPEDDLLHYGKFSYDFFTYEEESSQPGWRLNTPFEYNLLRSMLAIDPRQRMTPSSALAHDFITMNHLSGERKRSPRTHKPRGSQIASPQVRPTHALSHTYSPSSGYPQPPRSNSLWPTDPPAPHARPITSAYRIPTSPAALRGPGG